MSNVYHRLVGYDRASALVAVEYEIPDGCLGFAKRVASVPEDDPDAVFCYELDPMQVNDLAGAIGQRIDAAAYRFYMEGYSEPLRR